MSSKENSINFTKQYKLLTPQGEQTLAIALSDWNYLTKMIDRLKLGDTLWKTISSVCFGCAPTALITALTLWPNSSKGESSNIAFVIWIAVSVVTLIIGLMAFWFAHQKSEVDKISQAQVLDEMKRMKQRFNEDLDTSQNISVNKILDIEQINSGETIHNSPKSLALSPNIPQKESLISNIKAARFLDWIDNTWNNDIRQFCYFQEIENGYRLLQNIGYGYEYKMILFDKEDINSSKMITSFTVEDGSVEIALRPRDLSPKGTVTSLGIGKYDVEFWIETGRANITVNGKPAEIYHDDPANYGYYAIMTSRKCAIVFHKLYFLRKNEMSPIS